jgi:hypothetical protein
VPLPDSDDTLLVTGAYNITNAKQKLVYRNAWATSYANAAVYPF